MHLAVHADHEHQAAARGKHRAHGRHVKAYFPSLLARRRIEGTQPAIGLLARRRDQFDVRQPQRQPTDGRDRLLLRGGHVVADLHAGGVPELGVRAVGAVVPVSAAQDVGAAVEAIFDVLGEVRSTEVLFWVGDGAFDMRNQRTLRAFVKVLKAANVSFAVLGLEERDSGDVARRLGDEATFQLLASRNIQTLAKYSFKRIVTCDPHSFHVLKNEYGAFDGNYLVQHHSTYMAEIIQAGALNLGQHKGNSVTYHDPCYLGRYNGEYEAPREVLRALGIEVKEMQRSGFRSRCCGGGGGAPITDIPGKQRIPDMRMDDIRETGAELVAVGCPQCTAMLEGVVEPRPLIKDIAELVADALLEDAAPNKPATPAKREPAEAH